MRVFLPLELILALNLSSFPRIVSEVEKPEMKMNAVRNKKCREKH